MDSEVARTLAELERKLQDLERALGSVGERTPSPLDQGDRRPQAPEYDLPGAVPATAPDGARLIDERLESAAAAAPAPATVPRSDSDESIDLVELARFRDRLQQTMSDLLADYERVIRLRSAAERRTSVE